MRAALLIWLVLGAVAHADPRSDAGLVWRAPSGCPDQLDVRARIERRLGMPIEQAVHGIEVEIAPDGTGAGFVARIALRGLPAGAESRVLTSARCEELSDAVAIVIARLAAEVRRAPAGPAGRSVPASEVGREAPSRWGGGIRTIGVSGVGAQPSVGLGGELAAYVRRGWMFAEIARAWWLPRSQFLNATAPARVDLQLRATAIRIGWRPEEIPLRAWIAGELGSLEGKGIAFEDDRIGTEMWAGVGAGLSVAWPMTPWLRIVGVLEAVVPFERPRFVLRGGMEVYRPDLATARSGLGLEIAWR
ncbi:MAG TPA: hypothetical protein VFT22_04915 [Kofleriaceae bacterium]|nr:hypothetical protein [Kofleriaceae bacterium]